MTILWSVVGGLVGAKLGGVFGFLAGGLLGFMIGKLFDAEAQRTRDLASRVNDLEGQLRAVRRNLEDTSPQPTTAPPAPKPTSPPSPPSQVAPRPTSPPPRPADVAPKPTSPPAAAVPPAATASAARTEYARHSAPREAPAPTWIGRILEGNIVAKIGVVILFLGVGFLLKYAYDRITFPPQVRILAVAAAGGVMLWLGRRWLGTRRLYSLILMGGGLGVWYLDLYFALKLYSLVSPAVAFVLFAVLGVATVLLAMRLEAKPLAALGLVGAFLAPILASTGEGRYDLLFSYYTLLNLFVLGSSWFRSWRELNLIGFAFTFFIAGAWGIDVYTPDDYALAQTFLVIFFLIYVIVPVLFALRQPPELRGLVDGTLVFGTPTVCAFLQWGLVRDMGDYALAISAGTAAAVYAALAIATLRVSVLHVLRDTYLSLAIALGTLAVFFALDAYPTFAFWALEAAALLWLGLRQRQTVSRVCALALQTIAILYFIGQFEDLRRVNPWFNDATLGLALIAVAAVLSAWLYTRYAEARAAWEGDIQAIQAVVASVAWLVALALAFEDGLGGTRAVPAFVAAVAVSALAFDVLGKRADIPGLRRVVAADVAVYVIAALVLLARGAPTPLQAFGWIGWPVAIACTLVLVMRHDRDGVARFASPVRQAVAWLLVAMLATWHGIHLLDERRHMAVAVMGLLGIIVASARFVVRERGRSDALSIGPWILAWASGWWLIGIMRLLEARVEVSNRSMALLMVVTLTLAAYEVLGSFLRWNWLRRLQALYAPILGGWLVWHAQEGISPLEGLGAMAWPLALALWAITLWRCEREERTERSHYLYRWQHTAGWIVGGIALTWGIASRFGATHDGVQSALTGVVIAALLATIGLGLMLRGEPENWPFGRHRDLYRVTLGGGYAWAAAIWSFIAQVAPSSVDLPQPYLPVLNPIDGAQGAALLALGLYLQSSGRARATLTVLGSIGFLWLNGIALRTIHFWADVPYEVDALLASPLVQAVLALLWTASALVLMTYASRARVRQAWIAGAFLLAVVIIKLFVNDIAQAGNVTRIVTFLGVGALLLAIGYFAPVPPAEEAGR